MVCFIWHLEKRFVLSPMSTGLQHTRCIVKMGQLVNLLWERCFNPVLVRDWQRRHQCNVAILIWNIWHLCDNLIHIDLNTLCKLTFSIRIENWHVRICLFGCQRLAVYCFALLPTKAFYLALCTLTFRNDLPISLVNTSDWRQPTLL